MDFLTYLDLMTVKSLGRVGTLFAIFETSTIRYIVTSGHSFMIISINIRYASS